MTRADTIARHLNAAGEHLKTAACPGNPQVYATSGPALSIDAAMGCINAAFLECLGGAAVAGEAAGPWVVRIDVEGTKRWHVTFGPATPDLARAQRWDVWGAADWAARQWGTDYAATVLPLAEAERMEAAAKPTPEPPKPAGWVVRLSSERATPYYGRHGFMPTAREAGPFASRADAILTRSVRLSETAQAEANILPVDAAGNVIEALPGVAWEAARAGEEAERLRGEVARLHETLRDVGALADEHANEWHALLDHARTAADEVCGPQPVISAREAVTLIERKAFDLRTEAERLRTELAAVKAERDALNAAEADLRHALRQIAGLVGEAVALGASTDMHCAVADEVRVVVEKIRAERDALAAEVQRSREQNPVRWAVVNPYGAIVCLYGDVDQAKRHAAASGYRLAPLYLAPVVRDHSGVIAQCEEALNGDVAVRHALRAALVSALAALRGAS